MPQNISSIQSTPDDEKIPDELTCEALWSIEKKGERPTILDVREEDEWEAGHIEWATHLPLSKVGKEAEQIFPDKNELIIACCAVGGGHSKEAVEKLKQMGYTNVKSLSGGYTGYCGIADNQDLEKNGLEEDA